MRAFNHTAALVAAVFGGPSLFATASQPNPIYMYVDEWNPSPQDLVKEFVRMSQAGVSHILMAFHLEGNPGFPDSIADTVKIWQRLSAHERDEAVKQLHALGTKIIISSGGESEGDYWLRQDPETYASKVCPLVKSLGADGIDFDKEGFAWTTTGVLDWMNRATKKCREVWPEAIITSAPQSPHLMPQGGGRFTDGILSGAGHDHYLVQYYNQGTWTQDTTYTGLVSGQGVGAVLETMKAYNGKMKPDQLVIGKPFTRAHAGSGFVDHTELRKILCKAYDEIGYRGGLMFWKLPYGQDLSSVTMLAAPCSSEPDVPATSAPASTTTRTSTSTSSSTTAIRTSTSLTSSTTIPQISSSSTAVPIPTTPQAPASGGIVGECKYLIKATDRYETFEDVCKGYCSDYAPGGPLTPWCPDNNTGLKVANCVVSQRAFCQLKK